MRESSAIPPNTKFNLRGSAADREPAVATLDPMRNPWAKSARVGQFFLRIDPDGPRGRLTGCYRRRPWPEDGREPCPQPRGYSSSLAHNILIHSRRREMPPQPQVFLETGRGGRVRRGVPDANPSVTHGAHQAAAVRGESSTEWSAACIAQFQDFLIGAQVPDPNRPV